MNYITLREAGKRLNVSRTTIRRWTQQHDRPLRTATMGRTVMTSLEWLDEFAKPNQPTELVKTRKSKRDVFLKKWASRVTAG